MDVLLLTSAGVSTISLVYSLVLLHLKHDLRLAVVSVWLLAMVVGFVAALQKNFISTDLIISQVSYGVPALVASVISFVALGYFSRLLNDQETARRRIAASEKNLQSTFDAIDDAILIVNSIGIIDYVNHASESMFGYPNAVLVGASVQLLMPGFRDAELFPDTEAGSQLVPEAGIHHLELAARNSDGQHLDISVNLAPITLNDQTRYLLSISDVGAQKSLEASLVVRDRAFAAVPHGILITDPHQVDNPIIYCNKAFEKNTGYEREEVIGRNCRFLQGKDVQQEALEVLREGIIKQADTRVVLRNYRKDGTLFWNELSVSPVFDSAGDITHFLGIQNDITEQRDSEEQLVARNLKLIANQRSLLGLAQSPSTNRDDSFRRFTQAASIQLNVRRTGVWLLEKDFEMVRCVCLYVDGGFKQSGQELPLKKRPRYMEVLEQSGLVAVDNVARTDLGWEFDHGYLREADITALMNVPIRLDGKLVGFLALEHLGTVRDWSREDQEFAKSIADLCALAISTERNRQMFGALRESESRLADAQRTARLGSFNWVWSSGEINWSDALFELLGLVPGGHLVTNEWITSLVHPEDKDAYLDVVRTASQKAVPFFVEYRARHASGNWLHLESRASMLLDESGTSVGFRGTVQDITERVENTQIRERLEKQLRQAQKLDTIGTLAGGIAHDFNNLLTPIMGFTELVAQKMDASDPSRAQLDQVLIGARRAKDLIFQLLTFSRHGDVHYEAVDLGSLVQEAMSLIRPTVPATVEIIQDISEGCGAIMADSSQMHQVLMNLCTNASQAMKGMHGTLTVSIRELAINEGFRKIMPTFDQAEYVCLSVTDTGPGIDPQVRERIFEPFFTTKPVSEGTGLGLSVLHGIVTRHHGEIVVDCPPEGGTIFSIYFPVIKSSVQSKEHFPVEVPSGNERILVVDDEAPIADMAAMMLEDFGYEVKYFVNSERALEHFKEEPLSFDLLLTDLTMPRLDGLKLAAACRALNEDLQVLVMTGYEENVVSPAVLESKQVNRVVRKPLIGARLAQAVREVLDAARVHQT